MPAVELPNLVLELATDVVINGTGSPSYERGIIDLLVSLYDLSASGDLVIKVIVK